MMEQTFALSTREKLRGMFLLYFAFSLYNDEGTSKYVVDEFMVNFIKGKFTDFSYDSFEMFLICVTSKFFLSDL